MITVKHSGNIGDIIYALPTVMHLSKLRNEKIIFYLNPIDNRMSLMLANVVKPLLEHQPYINSVEIYNNQPVDYDLDLFRSIHVQSGNLGELHAKLFNYDFSILKEQSIFVDDSYDPKLPIYDIVLNRTERYNNPLFPWNNILETEYKEHTKCFIGIRSEYDRFMKTFNFDDNFIDYIQTDNYLQVAWLIKQSKIFIGNCSSPYAIAETMKHLSIQESCTWCLSCLYERQNAYYFTNQLIQL
jgi:hypothetical protein